MTIRRKVISAKHSRETGRPVGESPEGLKQ